MRLYIIGNGFDIMHGLQTGYSNFKAYVQKHNQNLFDAIEEFLPVGDMWNELESALGAIDYYNILDKNECFLVPYGHEDYKDRDYDTYRYEVAQTTNLLSKRLKEHFTDWIRSVDIGPANTPLNYIPFIPLDSLFFSFNYTATLQQIYRIPCSHIKHIHGNCHNGDKLELGHAFMSKGSKNNEDGPDQDTRITNAYWEIDNYLIETLKPVDEIINAEISYFSSLKNVDEVYVFGHSLSEVDGRYFAKIKESIQPNTRWIVALYVDEEKSGRLEDYGIQSSDISYVWYKNL
ncbi:bacteriophage abortive infection AbiH family protein [Yersinia kristensenii]|uniref:bacteriophage abortive infection AbiH family protein n=1 Tax=Yersinia kristensenii TaxID=28152 RepID=UPI0011AA2AC5|nr:bacteriophage abortive infection AbiH family protein [Yersinia kristensenii]